MKTLFEETLLSGESLPDRGQQLYAMRVTSAQYQSNQNLAISAIPTSFGSDPDIFISKNQFPVNQTASQWHSTQAGSDTIVILGSQYQPTDNIYTLVQCVKACTYDIRSYYIDIYNLTDNTRSEFRWNGTSTTILSYYVPGRQTTGGINPNQFEIHIIPQYVIENLVSYVASDTTFNIGKSRKQFQINSLNGITVRKTEDDPDWCTDCFVNLIVSSRGNQKVYAIGQSQNSNENLETTSLKDVFINRNRIECFPYDVKSKDQDVVFYLQGLQGTIDFFISLVSQPTSITSSFVKMLGRQISPSHSIIMRSSDRQYFGSQMGTYFLCGLAHGDSSAKVQVNEQSYSNYPISNGQLYTFLNQFNTTTQFQFQSSDLQSQSVTLNLQLSLYDDSGIATSLALTYQFCNNTNCSALIRLPMNTTAYGALTGQVKFVGKVDHNVQLCQSGCYYLFTVNNNNPIQTVFTSTFQLSYNSSAWSQINVGDSIQVSLPMGQSQNFRVIADQNVFETLQTLSVITHSYTGDVDITVQTGQRTLSSLSQLMFDQVVLDRAVGDNFQNDIIISVQANALTYFQLSIKATFMPSLADPRLGQAIPLVERQAYQITLNTADSEVFMSYRPWWSASDNYTICFVSDNLKSTSYFYADMDQYPINTATKWLDNNDILMINGSDPKYAVGQGGLGTVYIRVRPNYSSIVSLIYATTVLNFYAFAQPPIGSFQNMFSGQILLGAAQIQNPTYYRHYLLSSAQTINITLTGLFLKGYPYLMVAVSDLPILQMDYSMTQTYNWISSVTANKRSVSIVLQNSDRAQFNPNCSDAQYTQDGGSQSCGIYIGVQCDSSTPMCAYQIQLQIIDTVTTWIPTVTNVSNTTNSTQIINQSKTQSQTMKSLPRYLTWDQEWTNGAVQYNQTQIYYLPIDPVQVGDFAIIFNKTSIQAVNGDIGAGMLISGGAGRISYQNWTLPSTNNNMAYSQNNQSQLPEIIESCNQTISAWCNYQNQSQCALIFNVIGLTPNTLSFFRIKIFNQTNKLYPRQPIFKQMTQVNETDYYWFISTDAVQNAKNWQIDIGLGIQSLGDDANLFVSVMDGRSPTPTDYDYKSTRIGADNIRISSTDLIFQKSTQNQGWDPSVGLMIVIGVVAKSQGLSYSLTLFNDKTYFISNRTDIQSNSNQSFTIPSNFSNLPKGTNQYFLYRWFNWQSQNFNIRVSQASGSAQFYLNSISEESYQQGITSDLPISTQNSFWTSDILTAGSSVNFNLQKGQQTNYSQFCYNCWYYLVAQVQAGTQAQFSLYFIQLADSGTSVQLLQPNVPIQVQNTQAGSVRWAKFLFDSKDPFEIYLGVASGKVTMFVGLDLTSIQTAPIWSVQNATIGSYFVQVPSDDPNFHLGTIYYICVYSNSNTAVSMLSVNQIRTVQLLANSIPQKFQFQIAQLQSMFFVVQIPASTITQHRLFIQTESLTSNFYPSVYLKQQQMNNMPTDFATLAYPTINDFSSKFDNQLSQLKTSHFYSYNNSCSMAYCFYTIAVYQNSYGLDDIKKPEFKLSVTVSQNNNSTSFVTGPTQKLILKPVTKFSVLPKGIKKSLVDSVSTAIKTIFD